MAFTEDLAAFFGTGDFAVSGTWRPDDYTDGETAVGIFDSPSEEMLAGMVNSVAYAWTYPATSFVGMDIDDELVIAGVAYRVRDVMDLDDGNLKRATLSLVSD